MAVMTIEWRADTVRMIDQRLLPAREVIRTYRDYRGVARAIRTMVIRGAPAIGVAAAMGVALGIKGTAGAKARKRFEVVAQSTQGHPANRGKSGVGSGSNGPRARRQHFTRRGRVV